MQTTASRGKTWKKTSVANLYLHRSGGYYYRVTVGGKQIWESLKTKLKGVAEARVAKKQDTVRASRKTIQDANNARLAVGQAIGLALEEIEARADLTAFRKTSSISLLRSWPELAAVDVRKITSTQVTRPHLRRLRNGNHPRTRIMKIFLFVMSFSALARSTTCAGRAGIDNGY